MLEFPTLDDLVARIVDDIDTTSPALFASIVRSPMNVMATALAGIAHGLYGYMDFRARQCLPTDAVGVYLEKWGVLFGLPRRTTTRAAPTIAVVTSGSGTIVKGTVWRRDDGTLYRAQAATAFTPSSVNVLLEAVDPGEEGSIEASVILTLAETVIGLALTGIVAADADGEDAEDDDAYRTRILARARAVPQGGAEADYIAWAKAVPGVGKAWVIDSTPPYVDVRIVSDDQDDLDPSSDLIDAVQAYIDDRRPVTAIPVVAAAALFTQNVNITSLTPNTATIRANVTAALRSFYRSSAIQNPGVTVYDTAVSAAIQDAEGVTTFAKDEPTGNNYYGLAGFPILGTVSFP